MTLPGAPGANCASELCAMIDGEKQGCVFFFLFFLGSSWNYFHIQMRIICGSEVIIRLTRRQHMYMYISLQTHTYCIEGEWGKMMENQQRKPQTTLLPPSTDTGKLISVLCWQEASLQRATCCLASAQLL